MVRLPLPCGEDGEFRLRLLTRAPALQPADHIPVRLFQPYQSRSSRNPIIHLRVHVVVRLLRTGRRWKKTDSGGHHSDNGRTRVPAANADCLADDAWIAV